jgi:hypothetical protein
MDRTVQSVPDWTVTGPDRGRTVDRPVPYHGPVQRWVGPPFTRKWTVPTRGPDRTVDRTVPDRTTVINKFIFQLLLFFIIF